MKLLIEQAHDIQYLTEEVNGKQNMYIEGVYMQMAVKNRNGRIYKPEHHIPAVERYIKERVEDGRAWGELGHPASPTIDHNNVSHRIVELKQDGNNYVGKSILTETPKGLIAKGLINCGGKLAVSSRGLGSLKTIKGETFVQEDFKLCTAADIVDEPSAPAAFMTSLMENTDWYYDQLKGEWRAQEIVAETVAAVKRLPKAQLQEGHAYRLTRFIEDLSKTYRSSK